ncbi:type II toxin-antitoxin system mRNA interferase toxin, RelE/StbE family [Facilibium subflavum]|uniref:type II toxin-antitoxin system mRNA interferase toxin, RelE/StbE family n=1 Tax=Facilibium subflavum TaxID=2219058 RepID=UPI000E64CEFB|nr:type II toxin-antitoxin system mRNA interferase toxin, RelE/StbE family [Facilibium subflavum]
MKNIVELTPDVQKNIKKLPQQVVFKLRTWAVQVEQLGLRRVMQTKGYHDEPLKGHRKGQRSIRLNKAYRAFYRKLPNGEVEIIEVFDVNKHNY